MALVSLSCGDLLPWDFPAFFTRPPVGVPSEWESDLVVQEGKIAKLCSNLLVSLATMRSRFHTFSGIFCSFFFGEVKLLLRLI